MPLAVADADMGQPEFLLGGPEVVEVKAETEGSVADLEIDIVGLIKGVLGWLNRGETDQYRKTMDIEC